MTGSPIRRGSSDGQLKYSRRLPLNRTSSTGVKSLLGQRTHGKVLFLAAFEELVRLELAKLAEVALEGVTERGGRGFRIGVGAAGRLGHDLVDHAEIQKVLRGDLQGFRGALTLACVLSQNRGAFLRAKSPSTPSFRASARGRQGRRRARRLSRLRRSPR